MHLKQEYCDTALSLWVGLINFKLIKMKYTLDNVCTGNHKADHINSRIMEYADDIAEQRAQKDWEADERPENFYIEEENGDLRMNAEAQDIYNEYYDEEVDKLYTLVNRCIEIHES